MTANTMLLNLPKLYKMTSTGAIQEWSIGVCFLDDVPNYTVTFGQVDGKLQSNSVAVPKGKNIGRSNETTAEEQCMAEAKSKWEKQKERKGYTEEIPDSKPVRPMLAKKYEDAKHKIDKAGYFVQPKLDGVRCLAKIDNSGNVELVSRTNKSFYGLGHIQSELRHLKNITLDGELYSNELDFQTICSLVRKNKNLSSDSIKIEYHVYDYVSDEDFRDRNKYLFHNIQGTKSVKLVDTIGTCGDGYQILLETYLKNGYEGAMIRNVLGPYEMNRRSPNLIKVKKFIDEEYEIVGWKTGKGKHKYIPTFEMKDSEGRTFYSTPEGSAEHRKELLDNADNLIGKIGTVRFFEYTNDGIPRFPIFVTVRDYE